MESETKFMICVAIFCIMSVGYCIYITLPYEIETKTITVVWKDDTLLKVHDNCGNIYDYSTSLYPLYLKLNTTYDVAISHSILLDGGNSRYPISKFTKNTTSEKIVCD